MGEPVPKLADDAADEAAWRELGERFRKVFPDQYAAIVRAIAELGECSHADLIALIERIYFHS